MDHHGYSYGYDRHTEGLTGKALSGIANAAAGAYAGIRQLYSGADAGGTAGGKGIYGDDKVGLYVLCNAADYFHGFHPCYAKYPRRYRADRAHRAGQCLRHIFVDMTGNVYPFRYTGAKGIRGDGTIAKANHQHRGYNGGIGADTTEKVLNRLKVSLFDLQPAKVVLLIGVNDIIFDLGVNNLLLNYGIILNDINLNLPNTEVLCLSILPMNQAVNSTAVPNVEKSNQIIMDVNIEIEKIVDEYDYEFVNLFPEFADDNNYLKEEFSDDGLHLNHNGYVVLSNKLKPMLM